MAGAGDPIFLSEALTFVGTQKLYPLGSEYVENDGTYGRRKWRYIFNNNGNLAANVGCMQENGISYYEAIISGAACPERRLLGVSNHAIADASYGWVICEGVVIAESDGSTTADTAQECAANGRFTDIAAATRTAWALDTENPAGAGGLVHLRIKC